MADLYWIDLPPPWRLAIMARPRAGDWLENEVTRWRDAGVQIVVSLLEPAEVSELELQGEASACREARMEFMSFPISDRAVPDSRTAATKLAEHLARRLSDGVAVAIHCRAGIGRSSMIAAYVIALLDPTLADPFALIAKSRGVAVPDTDEQRNWVCKRS